MSRFLCLIINNSFVDKLNCIIHSLGLNLVLVVRLIHYLNLDLVVRYIKYLDLDLDGNQIGIK
jgi:hypothetical protein